MRRLFIYFEWDYQTYLLPMEQHSNAALKTYWIEEVLRYHTNIERRKNGELC